MVTRNTRVATVLLGAVVLAGVAGPTTGSARIAATATRSVLVSAPLPDQQFTSGPIQLSGSASAAPGQTVSTLTYSVQDRFTNKFLHPDGTFGAYRSFPITPDQPGAGQTTWSATITAALPPDEYGLNVVMTDSSGSTTATAQRFAMPPSNPSGPGYLTIQWGRSLYSTNNGQCQPLPNSLTIVDIARDLQSRGLVATGAVVIDRTFTTGHYCDGASAYSNWTDLATLRDQYGWTFVSDGMTHDDITKMTADQQRNESCGSLPALQGHGHTRAGGLFAYGDNHFTTAIQTNVVSTCFAYGRVYRGGRNFRSRMGAPWFQATNSILGGNCAAAGAPCANAVAGAPTYANPQDIANLFNVAGDEWVDVQFYRIVTGQSSAGPKSSWDCTSPDWRLHWTSQNEMYCQDDLDWALAQIPSGVVVTDPATVGNAWGRPIPGS